MILVLLYWLFLFFFTLPFGLLTKKVLRIETHHISITLILGLFFLTTNFTLLSLFTPVSKYTFITYLILCVLIYFIYSKDLISNIKLSGKNLLKKPKYYKVLLAVFTFLAALESSGLPTIIDNETYYLQTIKWVNEYGLVKGLGNLHLFLAQASPWHILQAGLNFNWLPIQFNDINGFVFVTGFTYCFNEIENKNWIGITGAVFSVLFLLFLNSPSPDLPLLIITPILLWQYANSNTDNDFKINLLLFTFIAFIKITIAPLVLLFIPQLINRKRILFFSVIGFITTCIWITKNSIVSGYPLYPLTLFLLDVDWTIPKVIIDTVGNTSHQTVFGVSNNSTFIEKTTSWLTIGGLKGVFNKLIVILFLIVPFLKEIRQNKRYTAIYFVLLIHFLVLLLTSPQYRFFLPEIIFFGSLIITKIINRFENKPVYRNAIAVILVTSFIVFYSYIQNSLYNDSRHSNKSNFNDKYLLLPAPITHNPEAEYTEERAGNLNYYSPKKNFILYNTGNGSLPCVNKAQIDYFERKTGYIPQQRSSNIKDGFFAK